MWSHTLSYLLIQLLAFLGAWLLVSAVIAPKTIGAGFYRLQSTFLLLLILPCIPGTYWAVEYAYPRVASGSLLTRMSLLIAMCAFAGLFNVWRSRMHAARFAVDPLGSRSLRTSLTMGGVWLGLALFSVLPPMLAMMPEYKMAWAQGSVVVGGLLSGGLAVTALVAGACKRNPEIGPEALHRVLWVTAAALGLKLVSSAVGTGWLIQRTLSAGLDLSQMFSAYGLELSGRWLAGLLVPAAVVVWLWRLLARNQRPAAVDVIWLAVAGSLFGEWAGNRLLMTLTVPV